MAGTNWALGVQERSRALVSDHQDAERHYRLAIELLGQTRVCTELARSHLMYGEWLRRGKRRVDASRATSNCSRSLRVNGREGVLRASPT